MVGAFGEKRVAAGRKMAVGEGKQAVERAKRAGGDHVGVERRQRLDPLGDAPSTATPSLAGDRVEEGRLALDRFRPG